MSQPESVIIDDADPGIQYFADAKVDPRTLGHSYNGFGQSMGRTLHNMSVNSDMIGA